MSFSLNNWLKYFLSGQSNIIEMFISVAIKKEVKKTRGDTSITAAIRSRELCQAPICASAIIPLAGVISKSLSFSTLLMQLLECNSQRRLRLDSNARLEADLSSLSNSSSRLNERRHRG